MPVSPLQSIKDGAFQILNNGKQFFADQNVGGIAKNTVLGIPQAAKDMIIPTRGFTDTQISQAKPTFKDYALSAPKVAADITAGIGSLPTFIPGANEFGSKIASIKAGSVISKVGEKIIDFGKPTTPEQARAMNVADVLSLGVGGSTKSIANVSRVVAASKDINVISKELKGLGLAENVIKDTAPKLVNISDEKQVAQMISDAHRVPNNPLAQEATKHKSADEFVKAQQPIYHGTTETFNKFSRDKGYGGTAWFSDNKEAVANNLVEATKPSSSKWNVMERYIRPGIKLVDRNTPEGVKLDNSMMKDQLRSMGYGGIRHEADATRGSYIELLDPQKDAITKSQLTDIWNKANVDQKAMKSAQELAQSNISTKRSVSEADRLIASGKLRVVRRGEYDVYQYKKGGVWTSARDESSAVAKVAPAPKPTNLDPVMAEKLSNAQAHADILGETASSHPGKALMKYRSNETGMLPEVRGTRTFNGKDIKARRGAFNTSGDTIVQDAIGQNLSKGGDVEKAQQLLDEYTTVRSQADEAKTALADVRKEVANSRVINKGKGLAWDAQGNKIVPKVKPLNASPAELRSMEKNTYPTDTTPNVPRTAKPLEELVTQTPPEKKVGVLDILRTPNRVLQKIGFGNEAKALRQAHDAYTHELPKNIEKITKWSKEVPPQSGERIFNFLDGKAIDLNTKEAKVAGEIKQYFADWADRLNLPKDARVTDYVTHLFDDQLIKKEFDEDLAKLITDKIPGQVYNPFLLKRLNGKGYKTNVWTALDAYTKRATRKVHLDSVLETIQAKAGSSLEMANVPVENYKYIQKYINHVNLRPTDIDTLVDNAIKSSPIGYKLGSRPTAVITRNARQTVFRAFLALNPASALRNLSQGANVYAKLGEKHTALGYAKLFSKNARREVANSGILDDGFIQDKQLNAVKKTLEKFDKVGFAMFDAAEKINRGAAYLGGKSKALAQGMNEEKAVEYAKKLVRDTQFNYDVVDAPALLQSDIAKTLGQFGTYPLKQSEFLIEMAKNKEFAGLLRYAGAGLAFVYTIGQAFNMKPTELIPNFRFGVPPTLQLPVEIGKAVAGTPDKYGKVPSVAKRASNVGKSAFTTLFPAGTQIRKTYQGTKSVLEGGSYSAGGKLQFPQDTSAPGVMQSILFGKNAGKNAQSYYDKQQGKPSDADKKIAGLYNKVQSLKKAGDEQGAIALYDSLSPEQQTVYQDYRKKVKTRDTNTQKARMLPVFNEVRRLKASGKIDEAIAKYDSLSEEDKHYYQLLRNAEIKAKARETVQNQ